MLYNRNMSGDMMTWVWLIVGIALIATELFIPGLVVVFLGLAAIIVAGLRWLGLLSGVLDSLTAWIVTSIVLLLGLRQFLLRWFPSERSFQTTNEDIEAIGSVVDVVHEISSTHQNGRIWFGGTSWPAISRQGVIPSGQKARLVLRDNLVWIVEPMPEIEGKNENEINTKP